MFLADGQDIFLNQNLHKILLLFAKFNVKVNALIMARKTNYLDFFRVVGKSKRLPRTGWVREKIKNPESIAERSFRVGVLSMILSDELKVNKEKLMKMSLIHDLGETYTGDLVWTRGEIVDINMREEKEKKELRGMIKLFNSLENGSQFIKIFEEMIDGITEEAKVFWQIDKLEMALQALEYELEQNKNLDEFFMNADLVIREPVLRKILEEILKERESVKRVGVQNYESS